MAFATTEQRKARLLDLTTTILELTRDGKRDYDEVIDVLQVIKDEPKFSAKLRRFPGVPDVISRRVWGNDAQTHDSSALPGSEAAKGHNWGDDR